MIGEKVQARFGDAALATRIECGTEVVEVAPAGLSGAADDAAR